MDKIKLYVLLRASKKTGKVDIGMTGVTSALMELWALQNTTKTKRTLIIERDTGNILAAYEGGADWPKITKGGHCTEYGISAEDIKQITDDRFDN